MIYTTLVATVLALSLVFYFIFGGADFGAGIIELFVGDKGNKTISNAMAPVWEANHIWLIIAVVILFNGFPSAYATVSTALHLPIMAILLGIIVRGSAFTFRHYDAIKDGSQYWYSLLFRYSSVFTVFFIGVTASVFFSGSLPSSLEGQTFHSYYIAPWFNIFALSVGVFTGILTTYIAALFLFGEVETEEGYSILKRFSLRLFIGAIISGLSIFFCSWQMGLEFHQKMLFHPISILAIILATAIAPFIFKTIRSKEIWKLRFWGGLQMAFILIGLFAIQFPALLLFSDGSALYFSEAAAPVLVMKVLFFALLCGVVLIFPALYYLFKVFKT